MTNDARHYFWTPGLGLLLLNVGAVSLLSIFWDKLPSGYGAEFTAAFVAFSIGVICAALSVYYRFWAEPPADPGDARADAEVLELEETWRLRREDALVRAPPDGVAEGEQDPAHGAGRGAQ